MRRITESPHSILFILVLALIILPCSAWAAKKEKGEGKKKKQKKAAATAKAGKADADKKDATAGSLGTPPSTATPANTAVPAGDKPAAMTPNQSASGASPVTRGHLKIELTLAGTLEASSMTEVSIVPKQWAQLTVVETIPAGTRVNPGQTLLKLDTIKIDEAIRELESTRAFAELGLKQAIDNFAILEKSMPLDAQLADRAKKMAEQDYELYLKVDAAQSKKSADFLLRSSEQNLEYVSEELKQLEKMYAADDLTEETEEIILKRAKNDVDRAQHLAEQARLRFQRSTAVDMPRTGEQQAHLLQQALVTWEKSRLTLPAQLQRQRLELEKMQLDHTKAGDKLADLKRDRDLLTVRAPVAGVVHYGRSQYGKWITASTMAEKYRPGNQVLPYEVLFTIVSNVNWTIRSRVPEKDVDSVHPGVVGRVALAAYPKSRLPVKVREVASVPNTDGSFDVALDVLGPSDQLLISGMSAEVKLGVYFSADAITIPTKAILADDEDDDKKFVYAIGSQGKPEKRGVTTGHVKGEMTEVVTGLSAGDSILLQKPTP